MRYLGKIYNLLDSSKHIKDLIQRDIVIRSFRHVYIDLIKDCSPVFLPDLLSHLLNCLLGPEVLLKALNNRKIKPDSITFPEISKVSSFEKPSTDKKKQKKKKEEEKTEEESEPLFKV